MRTDDQLHKSLDSRPRNLSPLDYSNGFNLEQCQKSRFCGSGEWSAALASELWVVIVKIPRESPDGLIPFYRHRTVVSRTSPFRLTHIKLPLRQIRVLSSNPLEVRSFLCSLQILEPTVFSFQRWLGFHCLAAPDSKAFALEAVTEYTDRSTLL